MRWEYTRDVPMGPMFPPLEVEAARLRVAIKRRARRAIIARLGFVPRTWKSP